MASKIDGLMGKKLLGMVFVLIVLSFSGMVMGQSSDDSIDNVANRIDDDDVNERMENLLKETNGEQINEQYDNLLYGTRTALWEKLNKENRVALWEKLNKENKKSSMKIFFASPDKDKLLGDVWEGLEIPGRLGGIDSSLTNKKRNEFLGAMDDEQQDYFYEKLYDGKVKIEGLDRTKPDEVEYKWSKDGGRVILKTANGKELIMPLGNLPSDIREMEVKSYGDIEHLVYKKKFDGEGTLNAWVEEGSGKYLQNKKIEPASPSPSDVPEEKISNAKEQKRLEQKARKVEGTFSDPNGQKEGGEGRNPSLSSEEQGSSEWALIGEDGEVGYFHTDNERNGEITVSENGRVEIWGEGKYALQLKDRLKFVVGDGASREEFFPHPLSGKDSRTGNRVVYVDILDAPRKVYKVHGGIRSFRDGGTFAAGVFDDGGEGHVIDFSGGYGENDADVLTVIEKDGRWNIAAGVNTVGDIAFGVTDGGAFTDTGNMFKFRRREYTPGVEGSYIIIKEVPRSGLVVAGEGRVGDDGSPISGPVRSNLAGLTQPIGGIGLSGGDNEPRVVSADTDGRPTEIAKAGVALNRIESGEVLGKFQDTIGSTEGFTYRRRTVRGSNVYSNGERTIAIRTDDGVLKFWEEKTFTQTRRYGLFKRRRRIDSYQAFTPDPIAKYNLNEGSRVQPVTPQVTSPTTTPSKTPIQKSDNTGVGGNFESDDSTESTCNGNNCNRRRSLFGRR